MDNEIEKLAAELQTVKAEQQRLERVASSMKSAITSLTAERDKFVALYTKAWRKVLPPRRTMRPG